MTGRAAPGRGWAFLKCTWVPAGCKAACASSLHGGVLVRLYLVLYVRNSGITNTLQSRNYQSCFTQEEFSRIAGRGWLNNLCPIARNMTDPGWDTMCILLQNPAQWFTKFTGPGFVHAKCPEHWLMWYMLGVCIITINFWVAYLKIFLGPVSSDFDFADLRWSSEITIFNKHLRWSDAVAGIIL